ncbi:Hypothetical protein Trvi_ORF53 [Trabala vishnou gigantina nucleopolyhedrovirus]|uniref:Hypothetical protein n=1 Tax=Trabala vishnou gigantina nucleopolyhedrovirus TaxID=2863583 RepID=UPI002481AA99|nr:Hypothetical protein QKU87_gp053 [Trabala vishnou gigantina nucleopolyhedrovirus]QYC92739.1 Hypothetical protein Trvi_ORF53 [Trabala vishnou gigantina nucleopolyhedrovirus]
MNSNIELYNQTCRRDKEQNDDTNLNFGSSTNSNSGSSSTILNSDFCLNDLLNLIKNKDIACKIKDEQISELICAIIKTNNQCVELSFRLANIIDDVIVKPQNGRLLHALAVCELSCNRFAFLRTQLRTLKRSIKKLSLNENVEPKIIYMNDYVPNSINVLNKIKESLPKNKYTAKNNKIQLIGENSKMLIDILSEIMKQKQPSFQR